MQANTQTMVVHMENQAGALANMVGLFSQRMINIDSLTVFAAEHDNTLSTLTLTTATDIQTLALLGKQIERLVDVISVELSCEGASVAA